MLEWAEWAEFIERERECMSVGIQCLYLVLCTKSCCVDVYVAVSELFQIESWSMCKDRVP